jgi:Glycosyltransferase 61
VRVGVTGKTERMQLTDAVAWLRRWARRLTGPLARSRSGYFFAWSRALLALLQRFTERTAVRGGVDIVTLDALPQRTAGAWYRELEPAEPDTSPPAGWAWPAKCPASVRRVRSSTSGQGVLEIPGGTVFGWRGHFGPDPDGLLANAGALWGDGGRDTLVEASAVRSAGVERLDGVAMSLWINGFNYAHCLLQSVPRLDLLRRGFGFEADHFLVNAGARPPTMAALAHLGIPADRLHFVPADACAYRCETLRTATTLKVGDVGVPWATRFLHEVFLPEGPIEQVRRIYVRRGVSKRAVLNEEEVLALLVPAGFEAVTMDGRSVAEQAEMFAGAEVIVSTHGAALANLVFSRAGTTAVELMGRNSASNMFAFLAWRRGLKYQMIMGTEPAPPDRWWTWQIDADTLVDVCELRNCLERLAIR